MSTDSESHSHPSANAAPDSSSEFNDLLGVISADSLAGEVGPSVEDREKYLQDLRAAIERSKEMSEVRAFSHNPFLKTKKTVARDLTKQTILHIDDDQSTLILVSQILTDAGYQVVSAQSGFEGVDQFRRRPFDFSVVVTDLTMPLMDGEETFRRLREIRPDVSVILATGFIQEERLAHLKNLGLAGFLRKPIPPDEIVTTIRSTLESVKYSGGNADTGGAMVI